MVSFYTDPSKLVDVDASVILPGQPVFSLSKVIMALIGNVNESSVDELSSLWQAACEEYTQRRQG